MDKPWTEEEEAQQVDLESGIIEVCTAWARHYKLNMGNKDVLDRIKNSLLLLVETMPTPDEIKTEVFEMLKTGLRN